MGIISRGFSGRRSAADVKLPPGQYLTTDFPVRMSIPMNKLGSIRRSTVSGVRIWLGERENAFSGEADHPGDSDAS
jgi:hypothetical protein